MNASNPAGKVECVFLPGSQCCHRTPRPFSRAIKEVEEGE